VKRLVLSEPNLDGGGGDFSRSIAQQSEARYVAEGHAKRIVRAAAEGETIWCGSMQISSPLAVHRGATSLVRGGSPSWRYQLAGLAIPRTVLFGERSLPDRDTERLPRAGIAVRIVPDAAHSMMWDNPSAVAAIIREALS
jgi:pimeloyl-ACP methyl ester carboxylesterase